MALWALPLEIGNELINMVNPIRSPKFQEFAA